MNFHQIILNIFFPQTKLEKKLSTITAEELFNSCLKTTYYNKTIIPVFNYEDSLIRKAIWMLKFKHNKRLAEVFGQILYDELIEGLSERKIFSNFNKPLLIPIPISKKRKRDRGYNQSELITKEMFKLDQNNFFELQNNILIKKKDTLPQSRTKNRKEREFNLKNCFGIKKKNAHILKGRNVILLDDVVTTGTTLNEAKKVLRRYGAKKIIAITVAH